MTNTTIFRLDFTRGTVEEIDEAIPPRGVSDASARTPPEDLPNRAGYVLAALGTPPQLAAED